MKRTLRLVTLMLVLCALCIAPLCTAQAEDFNADEFAFAGEASGFGDNGDVTYHFNIENDEEGTLFLSIDELPTAEILGTYEYVDGKGYKFYFEDSAKSVVYTKYDPATKAFTFQYKVNLGAQGCAKVLFTYENEAFAGVYDGEGLGFAPPVFEGYGYGGGSGHTKIPVDVTCYEDGTLRVNFTGSVNNFVTKRTGTWSFDEAANVYHFHFDEEEYPDAYLRDYDNDGGNEYRFFTGIWEGSEPDGTQKEELWDVEEGPRNMTPDVDSVYDEATKTYTIEFVAVSLNYVTFTASYTVE